jgi:hypothetical protein
MKNALDMEADSADFFVGLTSLVVWSPFRMGKG